MADQKAAPSYVSATKSYSPITLQNQGGRRGLTAVDKQVRATRPNSIDGNSV